ncbi:hypothetical protein PIB30_072676 [Stylosanthes scabra]|uniref:Uncharacterized protein n=1 Tax=Stylosanthes scabra TaxID=79078 RepID=A0ABU6UP19_9FABA|nr:hypothetical protein [Stylosanthes scabra]
MPVPTANELVRSIIRPSRSGPVANQWTVSLKAHQEENRAKGPHATFPTLSGIELISKEDNRAKEHHTPPPISQGLRGNITRSTRRKIGLRGFMPPSQLSLGFLVIHQSSYPSSSSSYSLYFIEIHLSPLFLMHEMLSKSKE